MTLRQAAQAALDAISIASLRCVSEAETCKVLAANVALREALAAPEQELHGWMIEGAPTVMRGAFAELDAKAEAKRIGGTCKAYPVYREPIDIEAITKERDALAVRNTSEGIL